jgi:hypothetical protein
VIQDDSFPFGRYLGPIGEFPGRYQQSYAELFRRAEPINFGIGYRWRTNESNLLLSVKTANDGTAPVETTSSADPPPPPARPKKPKPPPPAPRGFLFWGR